MSATLRARISGALDSMASGAVLMREAARTSRRWQTYAARAGFSGALFGVLLLGIWISVNAPFVERADMGWLGRWLFIGFTLVQTLLAVLLAPLLTASAIIEETDDRTLEMLVLSTLKPGQILGGKVLSRVLMLVTIVLGAMPVMALVVTLGGVGPQQVVAVTLHTLVCVVLLGSLGAFFGLFTKSPMLAMMASASYTVPVFMLTPMAYVMCTMDPSDAVQITPLSGFLAQDWSSPLILLAYLPTLAVIHTIGTRLFELKVSGSDIRHAFSATTWSTSKWLMSLAVLFAAGATVLPASVLASWFFQASKRAWISPMVDTILHIGAVGGVWLWFTAAIAVGSWALLRVGVDVVDAMDAILSGRGKDDDDRSKFRVWSNPVAWREARPRAWGANGVPVLGTWLLVLLGMVQTGWWVIPGGSLALGLLNSGAALLLTLWLAARTVEEERKNQSLEVLLTTTLPSWRILAGKALGITVPTLPLVLLSLPFVTLGVPHLHLYDLTQGEDVAWGHWLIRGALSWVWLLPLWLAAVFGGMLVGLRVRRRRSGFGLSVGLLVAFLGIPTVIGRFFEETPLLAVPARMLVPPLAGGAELWHYAFSVALLTATAITLCVVTSRGLRRWVASALVALLCLGIPQARAQEPKVPVQDKFVLLAEPLADGVIRGDRWAAVRVRVQNLGPPARGTLSMVERSGTTSTLFERPIELPQGTVKDVVLIYEPNTSSRDRTVELVASAGRSAVATFRVTPVRDQDVAIGVIGDDMLGIQGLRATWPGEVPGRYPRPRADDERQVRGGLIPPAAIPGHAAGLSAYDWLVWHQADPTGLDPDQARAVRDYVADGGHLLLTATDTHRLLAESPLAPLLPMQLTGVVDQAGFGGLAEALGGALAQEGVWPVAEGQVAPQPDQQVWVHARVALENGEPGTPLWVSASYGLGTVHLLLADPRAAPVKDMLPNAELWRRLLWLPAPDRERLGRRPAVLSTTWNSPLERSFAVPPDTAPLQLARAMDALHTFSDVDFYAGHHPYADAWEDNAPLQWEAEVREWLADIPGLAPIPMSWLLVFSGLYLLAIGPVDWFVLRALKRQPWTWVTFPVTIVLFSGAALAATTVMKGSQAMVSTVEVVDLLPGSDRWRGELYTGVFATRRTQIQIHADVPGAVVQPMQEAGYLDGAKLEIGTGPGRLRYTAETWTLGYTRASWTDQAPGRLTLEVLGDGWAVTNGLPFALTDAELILAGPETVPGVGRYPLGRLEAGERKELPAGSPEPLDQHDDGNALDWARWRLLNHPEEGRGHLDTDGLSFLVIGLAENRIAPLVVDGVRPIHRNRTFVRAPLTPSLSPDRHDIGLVPIPGAPSDSLESQPPGVAVIETKALAKSYGSFNALRGIDLSVESGDVYGFIGPNGAGKTTTIRILTTLLEPTAGEAFVDGKSVWEHKDEIRAIIGYMPDNFGVYRDMTVTEYLHFFAAAYGIPHKERKSLVGGLLKLTDLSYKETALIESLSRGMQQRLGLARTLVHDPKVLILDEPASGLDPRARIEIREILKELRRMGKTILLSSHILSELEEVCTRVGILERGELVAQGTMQQVIAAAQEGVTVHVRTTDDPRAAVVLRELPGVLKTQHAEDDGRIELSVSETLDLAEIGRHLYGREIGVRSLVKQDPTLEEVFMALTEGLVQ